MPTAAGEVSSAWQDVVSAAWKSVFAAFLHQTIHEQDAVQESIHHPA